MNQIDQTLHTGCLQHFHTKSPSQTCNMSKEYCLLRSIPSIGVSFHYLNLNRELTEAQTEWKTQAVEMVSQCISWSSKPLLTLCKTWKKTHIPLTWWPIMFFFFFRFISKHICTYLFRQVRHSIYHQELFPIALTVSCPFRSVMLQTLCSWKQFHSLFPSISVLYWPSGEKKWNL